jgi:hypothetical protein
MDEQSPNTQISFLLSDFNTRLKDLEERNSAIRERVLLLGKNLLTSKEETDTEIESLKKQVITITKDVESLKNLSKNLLEESDKYVKRSEVLLIERMLKDFQPLDFARRKDLEELEKRLDKTKTK